MIQSIEFFGISIELYDLMNTLFVYASYIFILLQEKAYQPLCPRCTVLLEKGTPHEQKKSMRLALKELFVIGLAYQVLMMIFNRLFGRVFTTTNANYYGTLFAWGILMSLLPYALRISPLKISDLLCPILPLGLAISKIGCVFAGCCSSFEMPSFYYNPYCERYEFPIQLLESAIGFFLFLYLLKLRKRAKCPGFIFPVYTVAYSATRFFTEFLRTDSEAFVYFLNRYQINSLMAFIIGLYLLILIDIFGEKIEQYSDTRFQYVITQNTETGHKSQQ